MRLLRKLPALAAAIALAAITLAVPLNVAAGDSLYIGDEADNTVKRYDAATGAFISVFVSSGSGGLDGPRGVLFDHDGNLLVANLNATQPNSIQGAILRFDGTTGALLPDLVPSSDKNAPFAPFGIILGSTTVYVADAFQAGNRAKGGIRTYDAATGAFLGDLKVTRFDMTNLHPNGLVFSPADGGLYVSLRDLKMDGLGGHVLRFNPDGSFDRVVIADSGGVGQLNRAKGPVFGPDGNLYVISYRANSADTSSIRIYSPGGEFLGKFDLDAPFGPTRRAQSILFGPKNCLFVPIFDTGEVRRYNVGFGCDATPPYEVFVSSGGTLTAPWFMTFGHSDPKTLEYRR